MKKFSVIPQPHNSLQICDFFKVTYPTKKFKTFPLTKTSS
nr:MAG TPA: hypothetical protein [Caudoviricetes sp.]